MRTFIFGIGGTGARVMRSLSMLLAAGAKGAGSQDVIIPIIIDYDLENHDTCLAREIMETYERIHNVSYRKKDNNISSEFFCAAISKLKDLQEGASLNQRADYQLYLESNDTNVSFADHINYKQLTKANGIAETADLLNVLYDNSPEDDPNTELNLNLEKGFKGCPNIGCVVTKSLTRSRELKSFISMVNEHDRVIVVGSIFGGTGASGIPMLLDLLRDTTKTRNVPVAVVAVTPYFNVSKDPNSAIDSDTFMAKTKAALDAYDLGKSVNKQSTFIYYVGDNYKSGEYTNSEGGKTQKNPAHIVELIAATMALHFMSTDLQDADNKDFISLEFDAKPHEMGMIPLEKENDVDSEIKIHRFYKNETLEPYLYPLMRFMIFSKFTKSYIIPGKLEKKDVGIKNSGLIDDKEYKRLLDKFIDYFYGWIDEIQKGVTKRSLNLFIAPEDATYENLFSTVKTSKKGKVFNDKYLKEDDIRDALNKAWEEQKNEEDLTDSRFYICSMSKILENKFKEILSKQ